VMGCAAGEQSRVSVMGMGAWEWGHGNGGKGSLNAKLSQGKRGLVGR